MIGCCACWCFLRGLWLAWVFCSSLGRAVFWFGVCKLLFWFWGWFLWLFLLSWCSICSVSQWRLSVCSVFVVVDPWLDFLLWLGLIILLWLGRWLVVFIGVLLCFFGGFCFSCCLFFYFDHVYFVGLSPLLLPLFCMGRVLCNYRKQYYSWMIYYLFYFI